ncbi:MAG TPA: type II toxin-antitoxin system VapC family toxin [Caulobacteraceae bacterium]|jgi:hypothetical protein
MYLLDTNVVSELRRPHLAPKRLLDWARTTGVSQHYLSAVSLMELELGVLLMERRDERQGASLRRWFEAELMPQFEDRILAIDVAVARCCARLHVPDPRSSNDAYIAATAIVHGLTVVTRNESDFRPTGVAVLNPWREVEP